MDAKEISKKVRDYFYEIHGQFGVVGFRIENVLYDKKENIWTIECSFLQSMMAPDDERVFYRVIIDPQGNIKNITKEPEEKRKVSR